MAQEYDMRKYIMIQKKVMQLHRWLEGERQAHDPGSEVYFDWSLKQYEAHCQRNHALHTLAEEFREAFETNQHTIDALCNETCGNKTEKCAECTIESIRWAELLGLKV